MYHILKNKNILLFIWKYSVEINLQGENLVVKKQLMKDQSISIYWTTSKCNLYAKSFRDGKETVDSWLVRIHNPTFIKNSPKKYIGKYKFMRHLTKNAQ